MFLPIFRRNVSIPQSSVASGCRILTLAVAAVLASGSGVSAASYDWLQTTAGPFAWDNAGLQDNWSIPGAFPNAPADVANLTADLIESATIELNVPVTIGILNLGDSNGSAAYSVQSGVSGSLNFNNGPAPAQLNQLPVSAGDTIWAPITATGSLEISNGAIASLVLNGAISSSAAAGNQEVKIVAGDVQVAGDISDGGTGGKVSLVKDGAGALSLSGNNAFTGGVTLNSGTLNLGSATALGASGSTFQINGGTIANTTFAPIVMTNDITQIWAADFSFSGPSDLDLGTGIVAMTGHRQINVVSGTLAVGGTIAESGGAAGITKIGAGTLALSGANIFSGPITVSGGFLAARHNQALGTGTPVEVTPGASLVLDGGVTITGKTLSLAGEGAPTQQGALRGVNGDNVWVGDIAANTTSIMRIVAGSGTLTINGNINTSGTAANGLVFQGSGVVNGQITGDASMTRSANDPGTWTLNGENTHTGPTAISNGALRLGHAFALRNSTLAVNSAIPNGLQFGPGIGTFHLVSLSTAAASSITLTDTADAAVNLSVGSANTNTSIAGTLAGLGSLTKVGSGTLTLSNHNTFAGGVNVQSGIVVATSSAALSGAVVDARNGLGTGTVTLAGGTTLQLRANGTPDSRAQALVFGNDVTLAGSASISVDRQAGTGGTGKTFALGVLSIGSDQLNVTGGNATSLRFNSATLIGEAILNPTSAPLFIGNITESGGPRSLTKIGTGKLTIIGSATHTGGTNVSAGALEVAGTLLTGATVNGGALQVTGNLAGGVTVTAGTLEIGLGGYSGTLSGDVTNDASVRFSRADTATYGGAISGTGSFTKLGAGTLSLTGANNYSGATIVSNGTLVLDYADTATVLAESPLTLGAGTLYIKGAATGTTLQTLGNLTTTASLTGKIVLDPNGGAGTTLTLGSTWTIGGSNGLHFDLSRGGTVLSNPTQTNGVITATTNGVARTTVTGGDGRAYFATVSGGAIAPQTALTPVGTSGGSGNVNYQVSGEVTTTGNLTTGTLRIDTTSAPGFLDLVGGNLSFGRTAMLMDGPNDFEIKRSAGAGTIANVVIHQYGTGALTLSAPIVAGGGFTKNGGGLVIGMMPSGAPGSITLTDGVYRIGVATATPPVINIAGGVLELGSGDFSPTGLGSGSGQVRITANGGFSAIGDTRVVNIGGAGASLTWDQANFLPGNSTLQFGSKYSDATLDFRNGLTMGAVDRTVHVHNGSAAVDAILSGPLSGSAQFVKAGPGTLALTATSTFSGIARVDDGTLQVNGSLSGSAQVASGILQGAGDGLSTGVLSGSITVGDGAGAEDAVLSAGNGIGKLTALSALNFAADAQFRFELDSESLLFDEMIANGISIASGATFRAFELGTPTLLVPGTPFIALTNTSFDPINGAFANLPEGGFVSIGLTTYTASYLGGDGNDLELTAVVPEPATLACLLLGVPLLSLRRRRARA